ncbi:helix-turn-helix domain-containing protein [Paraburkholderia sp. EG287B]|uniref:helix-turn-helix domain-containing protein n=1 Tax=unclassified Paraburkholderia TaxID=2615204 RepID=UPI0034D1F17C
MAAQAVRDGMSQTAAAKTHGVSLRAVSKWMKLSREGGLRSLRPEKRGRRRPLGKQASREDPKVDRRADAGPMMLPFYLWTRESVAQLIEREYGITMSPWRCHVTHTSAI